MLRGLDGRDITTIKNRKVDLRDNAPEAMAMTARQLRQARTNVRTYADTKSKLRAVREALSLDQKYKAARLVKPFIIPVLVALLDTEDLVIRRLVAAKALGVVGDIYGQQERPRLPAPPSEHPMLPASTTPAAVADDPDWPEDRGAPDDQIIDVKPEQPELPIKKSEWQSDCPCGAGHKMSKEEFDRSMAQMGAARSGDCYPSLRLFDVVRHLEAGVDNLEIPKRADLTVRVLADLLHKQQAQNTMRDAATARAAS